MNIVDLPEDVLSEIFRRLDTTSKLHAWDACVAFRPALKRRSVIGRIALHRGHRRRTRRQSFADLAQHVEETNFSGTGIGMRDVMPFRNLRALDISRTEVNMFDAATLCKSLPRLTSLTVHFDWPGVTQHLLRVGKRYCDYLIHCCERAFARLEDVRFIGDFGEMTACTHPLLILQKCTALRSLRIELIDVHSAKEQDVSHYHYDCLRVELPSLKFFTISTRELVTLSDLFEWPMLQVLDVESWVWVLVRDGTDCPEFLMSKKLKAPPEIEEIPVKWNSRGAASLYLWHPDLERHNPGLCGVIEEKIRAHIPHRICRRMRRDLQLPNNAYLVERCALPSRDADHSLERPSLISSSDFNLDGLVPSSRDIRVMLINKKCRCEQPAVLTFPLIKFDTRSETLRHISYLSLECSLDSAFDALFEHCTSLRTLILINRNVRYPYESGFNNVIKNIYLSTSIKNLMYVDNSVDLPELLHALSRCPTLVCVCLYMFNDHEFVREKFPTADAYSNFFNGCLKLCSFSALNFPFQIVAEQRKMVETVLSKLHRNLSITITGADLLFNDVIDPHCDEFRFLNTQNMFESIKLKFG